MKIPDDIKEFCQDWFAQYGMIGPFLLCRKFKIKVEEARKILQFLKYPKKRAKKQKVDAFTEWCEANGVPTRKPRGKKALGIPEDRRYPSYTIRSG